MFDAIQLWVVFPHLHGAHVALTLYHSLVQDKPVLLELRLDNSAPHEQEGSGRLAQFSLKRMCNCFTITGTNMNCIGVRNACHNLRKACARAGSAPLPQRRGEAENPGQSLWIVSLPSFMHHPNDKYEQMSANVFMRLFSNSQVMINLDYLSD